MHDKTVSQGAQQIDQSAVDKWYNAEWEKQLWNSEHAKEAFDFRRLLKSGAFVSVPQDEYERIKEAAAELASLISPYTENRVDAADFILSWEDEQKADDLIDSLDEIEKAAYSIESMEIIAGNKRLANPGSMLCFAITNHFWILCGGKTTYANWQRPYFLWNRKDGLGRLSEIVRGEVMCIANLAAKGWRNYFPFEETISLPHEFRMVSQGARENE